MTVSTCTGWGTGSLSFTAGQIAQSSSIDFNNSAITTAKLTATNTGSLFYFMNAGSGDITRFNTGTITNTDIRTAHYLFNNTATDATGSGMNLTPTGISYAAGKINQAAVFDGATSYLQKTSFAINNGSQQTICAWIYLNDLNSIRTISSYNGLTTFHVETDGRLRAELSSNTTNGGQIYSVGTVSTGVWTHVAMVINSPLSTTIARNVTNADFYINGVLQTKTFVSTGTSASTSSTFNIGAYNSTTELFYGMIDDFRVYKVALLQSEILSIYNSGTGLETDLAIENFVTGKQGLAYRFYSNRSISLGNPTNLQFTYLTDFSFSVWVKALTVAPQSVSLGIMGRNFNQAIHIAPISTGNVNFTFGVRINPGSTQANAVSGATPINVWHHVVGTYDSTDLEIKIYLDGVLKQTVSTAGVNFTNVGNFYMGGNLAVTGGNTAGFIGYLDEVRVYSSTLSQADVTNLFNLIDVPANLVGKWSFEENTGTSTYDTSVWEQATSGSLLTFRNSGADLRWRAIAGGVATISKIVISDYH